MVSGCQGRAPPMRSRSPGADEPPRAGLLKVRKVARGGTDQRPLRHAGGRCERARQPRCLLRQVPGRGGSHLLRVCHSTVTRGCDHASGDGSAGGFSVTTRALLLRVSGSHCQQPHREGQGGLPATELRSGRDPLSGAVRGDAGATPDPRCDRAATVFFRDPAPNARTHAHGAPIPHEIDQATLESTR